MELIKLLPEYYERNTTMQLLQELLSRQTENLEEDLKNTIDQCFMESSTAAGNLPRYEALLGIPSDTSKSDRYRRDRIKAKISGSGTTTASLIKSIAENYTNAEVELTEQFADYTVKVKFVGTAGMPGNIADIKKTIEEAVPAHVKIIYEYIFNTYGSIGTFTYGELSAYSHHRLRNGHLKNRVHELTGYQYEELQQLTHYQISKGELPNNGN